MRSWILSRRAGSLSGLQKPRGILGGMFPPPNMRAANFCSNRTRSLIFRGLLILFASITAFSQISNKGLAQVKTIHVESFPASSNRENIDFVRDAIGRELIANGFEVLEERSQADAVLTWESQVEIVLHGDGSIPNKSIFTLLLHTNNKQIWRHSIKFVSKKTPDDDLAYAVQKLVKKLSYDKTKAIKKGA